MASALTDVLPLGFAVALSPLPVIACVLMLLSDEGRVNAVALLCGWTLTIGMIAGVVVAAGIDVAPSGRTPTWAALAELVVGAALVAVGLLAWARRHDGGAEWGSRWLTVADGIRPPAAFGLAALLAIFNVKDAALMVDAGAHLRRAGLSVLQELVVLVLFALAASVAVAVPLAVDLLAGDRAGPVLRRWHRWLERHSRTAAGVLLGLLGVFLLGTGLASL
ncbi:MAG TPA: GAP family protein [Solirubrobacteraceae bacterium]